MPLPAFLGLTAVGSLVWNSVLVMAGYWLGDQWDAVGTYVGLLSKAVLILVSAALALYVVVRVRSAKGRAQHRRMP